MTDITRILTAIDQGDSQAVDELLPLVYEELRRLAAQKLAHERPGQTLQATALVHEAYLRLVSTEDQHWDSHGHFFAAAAEAMRRILIENARYKKRVKRGGDGRRVELREEDAVVEEDIDELLALSDAIERLAGEDPAAAELVKLRYFAGLSVEQGGKALGISRATAYRHWTYARAWIQCELQSDTPPESG